MARRARAAAGGGAERRGPLARRRAGRGRSAGDRRARALRRGCPGGVPAHSGASLRAGRCRRRAPPGAWPNAGRRRPAPAGGGSLSGPGAARGVGRRVPGVEAPAARERDAGRGRRGTGPVRCAVRPPACPGRTRGLVRRGCGRGGTGRHTELKIRRPRPCGFESRRPHHLQAFSHSPRILDRPSTNHPQDGSQDCTPRRVDVPRLPGRHSGTVSGCERSNIGSGAGNSFACSRTSGRASGHATALDIGRAEKIRTSEYRLRATARPNLEPRPASVGSRPVDQGTRVRDWRDGPSPCRILERAGGRRRHRGDRQASGGGTRGVRQVRQAGPSIRGQDAEGPSAGDHGQGEGPAWSRGRPAFTDILTVQPKVFPMTRSRPADLPEFRRRMVDLVRSGRTPDELPRGFEPRAASIAGRVQRGDADDGTRPDVMAYAERDELARLRRENWQERDVSAEAKASFAAAPDGRASRIADRAGHSSRPNHGPRVGRCRFRLLRLARRPTVGPARTRCRPAASYPNGSRRLA